MATEKIGIEVEVKGAEKSISSFKDLKTAIKAAKDEQIAMSEKFGASSVEAVNASKKIAELKDKLYFWFLSKKCAVNLSRLAVN